jgi:phosphoribosylformylglycinamidine synthase
LEALFNEELGVLLQVKTDGRNAVMQTLREHGLSKHSHFIGKTRPHTSSIDKGKGEMQYLARCQRSFFCQIGRSAFRVGTA